MKLLLLAFTINCFALQQKDNCSENKLIPHYHKAGNNELHLGFLRSGVIDTVYLARPSASWNCPVEKGIVFFSFERYDSVKVEIYLLFTQSLDHEKIEVLELSTLPKDYDSRYFIIKSKLRNYTSIKLRIIPYFKNKRATRYKISGVVI